MPEINLTDGSGFDVEIHPETQQELLGLLRKPARIRMLGQTLEELWNKPLSESPLQELDFGLEFESPVPMAFGGASLMIKAGIQGHFSVLTRAGKALFAEDRFLEDRQVVAGPDNQIRIPEGQACLVLGWGGTIGAGIEQGELEFGFSADKSVEVTNYLFFPLDTSFGTAVEAAFRRFSVPQSFSDLEKLQEGTVISVQGEGGLTFSFSPQVTAAGVPFATSAIADSAGALGDLATVEVVAGGSVGVSFAVRHFSSHEYRFFKHSNQQLRFGVYSQKGTKSSFELSAAAGAGLEVGGFDVAGRILGIFTGSSIDTDQLKQAGLTDDQIENIEEVVEKAVNAKLELGLDLGLEGMRSEGPAFLYQIDLAQARGQSEAVASVDKALKGDLTDWTRHGTQMPAGIERIRSLHSTARSKVRSLRFNLFGLFNHLSLEKLLSQSVIEYDAQGDAVLVLDRATAKRYKIDVNRLADQEKRLSRLVLDSVMITAAYCSAGLAPHGLRVNYRHFKLRQKTSRPQLKDLLDVAQALELLTVQAKHQTLAQADDFGRTSLLAETGYRKNGVLEMFVKQVAGGRFEPRDRGHFDGLGREAFRLLLEGDQAAGARDRGDLLADGDLWLRLKAQGNPEAIIRLPEVARTGPVTPHVFAGDYLSIRWWSKSMRQLSEALAELLNFLSDRPGIGLTDPDYADKRKKLAKAASKVADDTESRFDDPWGMIAMDLAAKRQGTARVRITIPNLSFEYEKERG